MADFWLDPKGGDATLWQLLEGTTDLFFACVGIDGDDDRVYAQKASDGTFRELQKRELVKTTVSTTYTALITDDVIYGDTSGGAFTITLPPLSTIKDRVLTIKKLEGAAPILTIDGDGTETIDNDLDVKLKGNKGAGVTLFPRTSTDWSIH